MKIDKLYTLSQFVDKIQISDVKDPEVCLFMLFAYNLFLKQPLKKYMFVNESKKPIEDDYAFNGHTFDSDHKEALNEWQEAEKKVIFYIGSAVCYKEAINEFMCHDIIVDTLEDLSIASEGELKLKNIEL